MSPDYTGSSEVPDQVGWVEKKACRGCLNPILSEDGPLNK
jgi:hypothetical protein